MRYILLVLVLFNLTELAAQDKVEREYRIKTSMAPDAAKTWLAEAFPRTSRVKWYFEETSGKESYEAKFRQRRIRYSVEFSTEGVIEDIEIERELEQLVKWERQALRDAFAQIPQFRLYRLQEQWSGSPDQLALMAQPGLESPTVVRRFEIEFRAVLEDQLALWEGTFNLSGELLSYRKVIPRSTDNLDF